MYDIIDLLIAEVKQNNLELGSEFDIAQSINTQLPFFSCRNVLFTKDIARSIQRYIYCTELGVNPYEGAFGSQPAIWVDTFFIIKRAFAKLEKSQIEKARRKKR